MAFAAKERKKKMKIEQKIIKPITVKSAATGQDIEVVDYPALLALDADVYLIFGMRSFGKSYGLLQHCIDKWMDDKSEFAYMRTIEDDVTQGKVRSYASTINGYFLQKNNYERELAVYSGAIMAREIGDKGKIIREPVGHALSLSGWMKYKSTNYDNVKTIILEEFLEKRKRLKDEDYIEGYLNNLSTIIRLRDNVKVFCLANTVKQKSPIFDYYKINLARVKKGRVSLFEEDNGLRICVYYTPDVKLDPTATKHYNVQQNKAAKMITSGSWQETEYPVTWEGKTLEDIQRAGYRRFRSAFHFYLSDINLVISAPQGENLPLVMHRPRSLKARQHRMTCKEFCTFAPHIAAYVRGMIETRNILTTADCFIDIDNFMDKSF